VEFDNKVVAITGAAGGIGQSMCRHFGSLGAAVAALDINPRVADFVDGLKAAGIDAAAAVVDIGDPSRVKVGFADLVAALGAVDILVNNAGFSERASLHRATPETWRHDVNGNLNGAFNCAHAVLPDMQAQRSGSIVNIGSINGLFALGDPAYSAAKAGLINFTKALAMEYGRYGIRANIILPGTVRTPLWEERASRNPKILSDLVRWYPLGRIVDPIDVARAAAFLVSDAAAAITGAVLPVDCGLSAGNIAMARELTLEPY
jgi:NAD(P)-dependent dehydrogenase (short-subunit alcohol dehydrogenase family)